MLLTDIAVNCGGKGGKPGPCKTVFSDAYQTSEGGVIIGEPEPGIGESLLGGSEIGGTGGLYGKAGPQGPEVYLSDFDKKNIARLVKETDKSLKKKSSAEIKSMSPDQLQAEMDAVFKPLAVSSIEDAGTFFEKINQNIEESQGETPGSFNHRELMKAVDSDLESLVGPRSGPFAEAFAQEYGVQSGADFASKLLKSFGGKIFQSPLVTAFSNAAKASPYYKKLQAAKVKAETPKPVKPPRPAKIKP